jgi:nitroimidazol reductase NimA-like FMN-containing flavoprotein (pyridoxamine 5'-phosphate oxidase superfamily)
MDSILRNKIIDLLHEHRIMTVATNRPDGWPQATTVGYVSDGLTLYFLCGPQSQKAQNLARDNRLSLAIDHDVKDPMAIRGLSMAARAYPVSDPAETSRMFDMLVTKYPEYAAFPKPTPEEILIFRVVPEVISVLDYSKGFGHTDLVTL